MGKGKQRTYTVKFSQGRRIGYTVVLAESREEAAEKARQVVLMEGERDNVTILGVTP